MKINKILLSALILQIAAAGVTAQTLPDGYQKRLKDASVSVSGDVLTVSTGKIERKWNWNPAGLKTISVKDISSGKDYGKNRTEISCDWNLPGAITSGSRATFISIEARESNDDGFVSDHIEVVTHLRYDSARLELQHVVWVFPGATGIRTQLRVKALDGFNPEGLPSAETTRSYYGHTLSVHSGQTEYLPLDFSVGNERMYWGYYNDPGSRHDQSRDMLREEQIKGYPVFQEEDVNWASGIGVDYQGSGVCVVKESHKCVNQQGHNTGSFYAGPLGLAVTGWGVKPEEIVKDRFRECWATWTILYTGGNDGMQLALKRFDRMRYPVFPERDLMIINDTWGRPIPEEHSLQKKITC